MKGPAIWILLIATVHKASSTHILFNTLFPSTTISGGSSSGGSTSVSTSSSGNSNNGGGGDGGCRPGYEYIIETTYQTSYEQQCRLE